MKIRPLIWLSLILMSLTACGRLSLPDAFKPATSASGSLPAETITYSLEAPLEFGGAWQRIIQVNFAGERDLWTVEKRASPTDVWTGIGFTDVQGRYVDADIAQPAEYRIAANYASTAFPGVADRVLAGALCEEASAETRIRAHRLIVDADSLAYGGDCRLRLEAEELRIDGKLSSFDPRAKAGRDARVLWISAKRATGRGLLDWSGERGADGVPGRDGDTGASGNATALDGASGERGGDGGDGLDGGDGTSVQIAGEAKVDLAILTLGGEGGRGAAGGKGGAGGEGRCGLNAFDRWHCGKSGAAGSGGTNGRAGEKGKQGTVTRL